MLEALTTDVRLVADVDVSRYDRVTGWLTEVALTGAQTRELLRRRAVEAVKKDA